MCGIAGLWDQRAHSGGPEALGYAVRGMTDAMLHRGPDAGDVWCDGQAGLALGHRRLSIIDLSPAGAQPMVSSCGRFVISFNGEVYNFAELRPELEAAGRRFRGHSDTEVIVEGVAEWGVEATVKRLIGMFAMALWDRRERALYLVRDRLGIKPVYWAQFGELLLFGSELKSLRAHPGWQPALNRDAVAGFLRLMYVPGPATIYQGVNKLPPGTILVARAGAAPELRSFWSLADIAREGQAARFVGSEDEAVEALDALLGDAVRRRMIADVPLGAFLSGGIDSSVVVALMQANNAQQVRSFSIGFHERQYNEAEHAKAVAAHLGTDHTELYVSPEHALTVIPLLPDMYDEPFSDASQIPTFLVSEMTRKHVTVALSGDGGDEVFGGYNKYFQLQRLFAALGKMPSGTGALAAKAIRAVPRGLWPLMAQAIPERRRPAQLDDKMAKLAGVLAGGHDNFYRLVISHWPDAETLVPGAKPPRFIADDPRVAALIADPVERMQYLDSVTYLPDDILTKVDRASMAVSLEARVPLLDHRVVAFSWGLKPEWKARPGRSKYLLRRVLDRYVPPALIERPKMGFAVPIDSWLRGPLRDWAESLLSEDRLKREGILAPAPIREKWREHLSGARNWQYLLWDVLMFQAWKERWLPNG
ncbi:MAG TPA: asparagine synthase (glutamine-hydrolyzing) [Stellaceae bacterium]|nr:asparagine synthase (glutamine-hydrolyzing) [Stellaceae bacterium]